MIFALAGNQTAARPRCSTSSPAPTSTWATFPASPWTRSPAPSGGRRTVRWWTAGHLFHPALLAGGDRHPGLHSQPAPRRPHQHRGRQQHRAEPVPDPPADGDADPHGAGPEHDGRGVRRRRDHRRPGPVPGPGHPGGAHLRREEPGRGGAGPTMAVSDRPGQGVTRAVYDFCAPGPVHRCIHAVVHQIEDHAEKAGLPVRFAATKLIEGDDGHPWSGWRWTRTSWSSSSTVRPGDGGRSGAWTGTPPWRTCGTTSSRGSAPARW